ncbi:MAG TPA: serine hydrolase domain-containing protein [Acidisoma sp.]|uniref:serine hydrolase domain-containing protein n=1 Tax=Acidisoma sp. TaxID=1872115 RepID=UPI002CCACDC6|nr:serine hydrolase domain-containing protein [Acidisoma sp.]HTI00715.1 serine hydrolase domain-containing protein [Acidisoma sp.]
MPSFKTLPDYAQVKADITALFAERVNQRRAPACFFSVFDAEGVLFEGGFGVKSLGHAPPDRQTRFRIASCTKSFTTAALLILRDAGKILLDDPITTFVPALRGTLPVSVPMVPTLRMLMAMSGGLPTDDPWADRQESLSREAFLAILEAGVRFTTVPGSRFEYSNLGYALLGQVVEQASGQPFQDFVTETLLQPLGLEMTTFDHATVPAAQMAAGYRVAHGEWRALPPSGPGAFSSIGGVISTGEDLTKWASWLCEAFRTDAPERSPLSAPSRREMQTIHCPIAPDPGEDLLFKGYGFGLVAQTDARHGLTVHHSGGYPGFSSHMRWNPAAGIGIVGFENATYSGVLKPVTEALERLLDRAAPEAATEPPAEVAMLGGRVAELVARWDDSLAGDLFLENVAMDRPYAERAAELAELRAKLGTPDAKRAEIRPADGPMFGRFEVRVPCTTGVIVGVVGLGPPAPARIQSLTFKIDQWVQW